MPAHKHRQKRSIKTERQIVEAAARLFVERGYSKVTMQQIADAAGIGKATLYYHTPSKEDLGLLVLDAHLDHFMGTVTEVAGADGTASARLRGLIDKLISWLTVGQQLVEFVMPQAGRSSARHARRLSSFRTHYLDTMERVLRDGMAAGEFRTDLDPAVTVRALLAMVVQYHVQSLRFRETMRIDDVREQLTSLALSAVHVRSDGQ